MSPRDWEATTYHRVADAMTNLGLGVLARLELHGDETVLDAGCGSGRVTAQLVERLPEGRVIAVDGSQAMIDQAREVLGDRAQLFVSDLLALDLGEDRCDVVFSTATFHWIADQAELYRRMHAALKPGGRLVAQCGGKGQMAPLLAAISDSLPGTPFEQYLAGFNPWTFASPEEAEGHLRAAGFHDIRAWIEEHPVTPEHPRDYLRSVVLGSHLERLPEDLREPFLDAVQERLPQPLEFTYIRLNIDAVA